MGKGFPLIGRVSRHHQAYESEFESKEKRSASLLLTKQKRLTSPYLLYTYTAIMRRIMAIHKAHGHHHYTVLVLVFVFVP